MKDLAIYFYILFFPLACALAQTPPTPRPYTPPTSEKNTNDNNMARFDLDFPGGTPEELIDSISKASGQSVNAIIPEDGRDFKVPSFQVHQVTVGELLRSLRMDSLTMKQSGPNSWHSVNYGYEWQRSTPSENNAIWVMYVKSTSPVYTPQLSSLPIPISELLDSYSIDDISTAVQLVWDIPGADTSTAKIKYHPETQLLILQGTQEQIVAAQGVLTTLYKEHDKQGIEVAIGGDVRYPRKYKFKEPPSLTEAYYRAGGSVEPTIPEAYVIFDAYENETVQSGSFPEIMMGQEKDINIVPGQYIEFRRNNAVSRKRIIRRTNEEQTELGPTGKPSAE